MTPRALSQRAFAAHVGCSPTVIARLIKRGKLPVNKDLTIPMPEGEVAFRSRPNSPIAAAAAAAAAAAGGAQGTPVPQARTAPSPQDVAAPFLENARVAGEIRKAELAAKVWSARLREQEFNRLAGDLIPAAEVESDARACADTVRSALLAIPQRVALQLEAIAAGPSPRAPFIEALVGDVINEVIGSLQSRFLA